MRISKDNIIDISQSIRNFIKTNKRLPNYATMVDMDTGKNVNIPTGQMCGVYYLYYMFWYNNGRFPNYVTVNIEKDSPMILNFQDNAYNCCPASLSMVSSKLFNLKDEETLAKILGTSTNGTNPSDLVANAPNAGFIVKAMARNPTNVANALNQYKGVICHYQTKSAPCSGFINDYGHYCVIHDVSNGYYTVWDPTKGIFKCPTSVLDSATEGRAIYYYSVELK